MTTPLISIVMSVYNGQSFLSEALKSISAQTLTDYEFIIVNDGSTDETKDILDRYKHTDSRVRVYDRAHHGLTATLNFGCRIAKGEYIARMDADDISTPARLERQIDFLSRNSQVAVLGGAISLIRSDGAFVEDLRFPLSNSSIKMTLKGYNCFNHSTVMMRSAAFNEVGGYRDAFQVAQDYDLWLRMSEKYEMANLPDVLVHYRLHDNQVSLCKVEQQVFSILTAQVASRMRNATGLDPISPEDEATRPLLNKLGVPAAIVNEAILLKYEQLLSFACRSLPPKESRRQVGRLITDALTFCDAVSADEYWVRRLRSLAEKLSGEA
jgi:glycosyltransferase involved in cell wall biosynthesis